MKKLTSSVQVALNDNHKADYYWINVLKNQQYWQRMYERKQLGEVLSDLDGFEEQMHRHLGECDELSAIVEGIGQATDGGAQVFSFAEGKLKKGHRFSNQPYLLARWEALKWSLWHECGVYVAEVSGWEQTIQHLVTAFRASYVEAHTTLRRYTVPHIPQMNKNAHIDNLMRLKGLRIGEVTAKRLVSKYETLAGVLNATETSLIGQMGNAWTTNFLKGVGRL